MLLGAGLGYERRCSVGMTPCSQSYSAQAGSEQAPTREQQGGGVGEGE